MDYNIDLAFGFLFLLHITVMLIQKASERPGKQAVYVNLSAFF
jgi:hypothetical protein